MEVVIVIVLFLVALGYQKIAGSLLLVSVVARPSQPRRDARQIYRFAGGVETAVEGTKALWSRITWPRERPEKVLALTPDGQRRLYAREITNWTLEMVSHLILSTEVLMTPRVFFLEHGCSFKISRTWLPGARCIAVPETRAEGQLMLCAGVQFAESKGQADRWTDPRPGGQVLVQADPPSGRCYAAMLTRVADRVDWMNKVGDDGSGCWVWRMLQELSPEQLVECCWMKLGSPGHVSTEWFPGSCIVFPRLSVKQEVIVCVHSKPANALEARELVPALGFNYRKDRIEDYEVLKLMSRLSRLKPVGTFAGSTVPDHVEVNPVTDALVVKELSAPRSIVSATVGGIATASSVAACVGVEKWQRNRPGWCALHLARPGTPLEFALAQLGSWPSYKDVCQVVGAYPSTMWADSVIVKYTLLGLHLEEDRHETGCHVSDVLAGYFGPLKAMVIRHLTPEQFEWWLHKRDEAARLSVEARRAVFAAVLEGLMATVAAGKIAADVGAVTEDLADVVTHPLNPIRMAADLADIVEHVEHAGEVVMGTDNSSMWMQIVQTVGHFDDPILNVGCGGDDYGYCYINLFLPGLDGLGLVYGEWPRLDALRDEPMVELARVTYVDRGVHISRDGLLVRTAEFMTDPYAALWDHLDDAFGLWRPHNAVVSEVVTELLEKVTGAQGYDEYAQACAMLYGLSLTVHTDFLPGGDSWHSVAQHRFDSLVEVGGSDRFVIVDEDDLRSVSFNSIRSWSSRQWSMSCEGFWSRVGSLWAGSTSSGRELFGRAPGYEYLLLADFPVHCGRRPTVQTLLDNEGFVRAWSHSRLDRVVYVSAKGSVMVESNPFPGSIRMELKDVMQWLIELDRSLVVGGDLPPLLRW